MAVAAFESTLDRTLVDAPLVLAHGTLTYYHTVCDRPQAAKKANAHRFIMLFPDGYQTLCGEKGAMVCEHAHDYWPDACFSQWLTAGNSSPLFWMKITFPFPRIPYSFPE